MRKGCNLGRTAIPSEAKACELASSGRYRLKHLRDFFGEMAGEILSKIAVSAFVFINVCAFATSVCSFDLNQIQQAKTTRTCMYCDFSFANLTEKVNLNGTNLYGANFYGANLVAIELNNAKMNFCNFSYATMCNATLRGAHLVSANMPYANLSDAILINADVRGANLSFSNLSGANFTSAKLNGTSLQGAILDNANLTGADLSSAIWTDGTRCKQGSIGKCAK